MSSESVTPTATTTHADVLVLTSPLNLPVSAAELINESAAVASLSAQITALTARVEALEQAAASETSGTAAP